MRAARAMAAALMLAAPLATAASGAAARTLIRDAEIERTLGRMTAPVLEAAGLEADGLNMYILLDPSLNAFVTGGRNIVLNTGLLRRLESPEAVIGVIAHEIGHITGGHLARRSIAVRNASTPFAVALAVAAAAAAASGDGQAGAAVALGSRSAIERSLLAYSRAEESAADQAAISYLDRAGIDPVGLMEILQIFKGQEVFQSGRLDPYALTHPLSSDRLSLLERRIAASPARGAELPSELQYWHARMRAKLDGFIERPERTLGRLETAEAPDSEFNLYRRAVAHHQLAQGEAALATVDRLLELRPDDPFYWELRGQILFESGRPAEAVAPYRRALALAPGEPLIAGGLGRALLASGAPGSDAEALAILEQAVRDDPGEPGVLRDLALAYARDGQDGMAALATAERFALDGDFGDARVHARRALDQLPRGSPGWLRADDIAALADLETE